MWSCTERKMFELFSLEKVKAAYQEGRQSVKGAISDTIKQLVDAQRSRDEALAKLALLENAAQDLELQLSQRDELIASLTSSGGNEVLLGQLQESQDQMK